MQALNKEWILKLCLQLNVIYVLSLIVAIMMPVLGVNATEMVELQRNVLAAHLQAIALQLTWHVTLDVEQKCFVRSVQAASKHAIAKAVILVVETV
jgi:hypothetical protein